MESYLDLCGQKWKPKMAGELTLFLDYEPWQKDKQSFAVHCQFVPPWLEDEDYESEHRTLSLEVSGGVPHLEDWRQLSGKRIEAHGESVVIGDIVFPDFTAPDIRLYSYGHGPIHTHADELWNTSITFGEIEGDGYELSIRVEAFCPSERGRKAAQREMQQEVREWFELAGHEDEEDEETEESSFEGWQFCYTGMVRLDKFSCIVPLNSSKPVSLAKQMTKERLNQSEFGWCYVNGGNMYDETFEPQHGVTGRGRLVILNTPSEYYRQWLAQRKKKGS